MIKRIVSDILVVIISALILSFLFFSLFDVDLETKEVIYKRPDLNRFDHVVAKYGNVYYSDLLLFGKPGDTIEFKKGVPYLNSVPSPQHFYRQYLVDLADSNFDYDPENFPVEFIYLTYPQYKSLEKHLLVTPVVLQRFFWDSAVYPYSRDLAWNADNFGPIVLPYRGMVLKLNRYTYLVYKPVIEKYEKKSLTRKNRKFYLNGKQVTSYTFKKNYYYLLNVNLNTNFDSRFWGPVPRKNIIGKRVWKYLPFEKKVRKIFSKLKLENN